MWIVVRYKKNQLDFLKGNLLKFFDHYIEFFCPKVKIKNSKTSEYRINPISKTEKVKEYRDAFRKSK